MTTETQAMHREVWREAVRRELASMGASVRQIETSAWRVARGSSFLVVSDLADLKPHQLMQLSRS